MSHPYNVVETAELIYPQSCSVWIITPYTINNKAVFIYPRLQRENPFPHTIFLARFTLAERMGTCIPAIKTPCNVNALGFRCMECEGNTFSFHCLALSEKNFSHNHFFFLLDLFNALHNSTYERAFQSSGNKSFCGDHLSCDIFYHAMIALSAQRRPPVLRYNKRSILSVAEPTIMLSAFVLQR